MNQVKSIKGLKEFKANGHDYIVCDTISAERYKEYEKLTPELTHGLSWQGVYSNLIKAFNLLNKPNPEPLNAGIIIHNVLNGIKNIDDDNRIHPALMMCALVINRKDEDQRIYNKTLMLEKISDWQAEGLDMMSFFGFALNTIEGFKDVLIKSTQERLMELSQEINQNP